MSLPRYPEYRDSSLEWLGPAPTHWPIKRLRFVAELNPSKSELARVDRATEVSFVPMEAISEDGSICLERTRPIAEVETGYTFFRDGDVTLAKITPCFENGKGALMRGLHAGIGFGTTELIVARPRPSEAAGSFLHWLFRSPNFRERGEASMYGAGGQKRVPDDFVRDFAWAFPPLNEQISIAAFLDRETAKIDALVAEQQKLVALLKEKRQALISHAVTKGLDPDVPMKDSGVEWLGEVPAHWELSVLKRCVLRVESGVSVNAVDEQATAGAIGVLKTSCVYSGRFDPNENKAVVPEDLERVACPVIGGTLIVSRMNTPALVGNAGFVADSAENLFLPDRLWQIHFSGALTKFAYYWTNSPSY